MNFLRQLLGKAPEIKVTPEKNPQLYTYLYVGNLIQGLKISGANILLRHDRCISVVFHDNKRDETPRTSVGDDPVWAGDERPALSIEYKPTASGKGKWKVTGFFTDDNGDCNACSWPLRWGADFEFPFEDTHQMASALKNFSTMSLWELTDFYREPETSNHPVLSR